jgi:hypothetical protein
MARTILMQDVPVDGVTLKKGTIVSDKDKRWKKIQQSVLRQHEGEAEDNTEMRTLEVS